MIFKNASIKGITLEKSQTKQGVNGFILWPLREVCMIITQQTQAWMCHSMQQARPRVPRGSLINSPPKTGSDGPTCGARELHYWRPNPLWLVWREPKAAYFISNLMLCRYRTANAAAQHHPAVRSRILLNQLVSKPNRSQRVPDFSDETPNSGPITRAVFPHSQILLEAISPFIIQHLKNKWLKDS